MQKMLAVKNCFSAENQSFWPLRPLKRPFCGTRGQGGGVTHANFCISRGSLSWLVAPRDAKVGTRDTTPLTTRATKRSFQRSRRPKEPSPSPKNTLLFPPRVVQKVWHSWPQPQNLALLTPPPHPPCNTRAFSKVSKPKRTDFQRKKCFATPQIFHPFQGMA